MVVRTPAATNPVPILSTECMQHIQVQNDYTFTTIYQELNPTCHLVALLGADHILHDSFWGIMHNKQAQNNS